MKLNQFMTNVNEYFSLNLFNITKKLETWDDIFS